jgi:hypothetical protein
MSAILISSLSLETLALLAGIVLVIASWPLPLRAADWGFPGFQGVAAVVFTLSGLPIARRRPENPIGWLMIAGALLSALQFAGHYYAVYGLLAAPGAVPAAWVGAWLESWIWVPTMAAVGAFPLLVFPTGRLPSPRWRPWATIVAAGVLSGTVGLALGFWRRATLPRPEGLVPPDTPGIVAAMAVVGVMLLVAGLALASAAVIVRFRRARGLERQQLKWLALAASVAAATFVLYLLLASEVHDQTVGATLLAVALLGIPVAIGIAIVRHRLFDIDHLINRALVYAALTIVLAAVYVGSVLALQALLASIVRTTELAVAGSTLLVAALFGPIRRRVQAAVDRRFYRSRYDAQRIADAFSTRLRDEVELDAVVDDLRGSVDRAMHPAFIGVWIRDA